MEALILKACTFRFVKNYPGGELQSDKSLLPGISCLFIRPVFSLSVNLTFAEYDTITFNLSISDNQQATFTNRLTVQVCNRHSDVIWSEGDKGTKPIRNLYCHQKAIPSIH